MALLLSSMATSASRLGNGRKSLPSYMQKQPKPQGSGAPAGPTWAAMFLPGKNPFSKESNNLTEQSRLYRTDRDMYARG